MTQLEKDIQADIVTLLETVGAAVYKIGTTRKRGDHQGTMQTAGIPDLCAFVAVPLAHHAYPPHVSAVQLWIEVKRPGQEMSNAQLAFQWHAGNAGCEHVTGGVDAVMDWLTARGVVK